MKLHPRIAGGLFASLLISLLVSPVAALAQGHGSAPHWSYCGADGPDYWGDLDPSYATYKNGQQQAPVDIENPKKAGEAAAAI